MTINSNSRRDFLRKSVLASAGLVAAPSMVSAIGQKDDPEIQTGQFRLKYAPSLGMFRASAGKDPIDNIKFCHDQGFRAIFDNGLMGRPKDVQERIAYELDLLDMEMGPFVLYADFSVTSFVNSDADNLNMLINKMKDGVEVAKRTNSKWALVVPGRYDQKLHWDYQTANVIENLKFCGEVLEQAELTMVLEPLNGLRDHPGLFLTGMPQSYMICRAVNNPYVKIVDDLYHQQITEGNLIPNIEAAYDEIAAFHLGDNPGRKEPTSGEINYKNIFKYIHNRGYSGVLCMEHGKTEGGKEGDQKVINAYRECDSF
ncbi:MAG: TIM barrel protein [Bacteroidota bacterium]|nr:TIM barrel protein [Bacteroidota bacterium]